MSNVCLGKNLVKLKLDICRSSKFDDLYSIYTLLILVFFIFKYDNNQHDT